MSDEFIMFCLVPVLCGPVLLIVSKVLFFKDV